MKKILFFAIAIFLYAHNNPYILVNVDIPESEKLDDLLRLGLDIISINDLGKIEIVVHANELEQLRALGLDPKIVIEDMERHYAEKMSGITNFGAYYTYSESNAILDSLHARFPLITTARIDLGYSTWNNNRIYAFKISDNPSQQEGEPEILFTGVHHAREPITVNMCVELARLLCENYSTNQEIRYLIDNRQIWIVPVMNPDGYLYNEQTNPGGGGMWRKNRRDNGSGVYGVDPNRNYAYQWGYDNNGSSPDPSAETYRGPLAFSEPCTQALRDFFNAHQFIANVDFHSYGNYILFPWGYRVEYTPDDSLFRALSVDMRDLALAATGQTYTYGIPPQILYAVNGSSDDWEYGEQSSKPKCLGFTFEFGEAFWQESEIDNHLAEGLPMCMYLIKVIGPWIEYANHNIDDGAGGNDTLDPGETVNIVVTLANKGITGTAINNVNATLSTNDNFVTAFSDSGYYGSIAPGGSGQNSGTPYSVHAHNLTPEGHMVTFTLNISGSNGLNCTSCFKIRVGAEPPEVMIFADDYEYGGGIDSFLNYWDRTGNWNRTTVQSHSPTHSAYSGTLVDGTVNFTIKNSVDLSGLSDPELIYWDRWSWDNGFWTDAWVDVSTNGGINWTALWTLPSNPPNTQDWTEKRYSLAPYISNNFKIRFRLFSRDFFQNFNDWFIDDFRISIPGDNEPPYFTNTTDWPDTTFTGPFPVQSTITDLNGIDSAYLYYRINSGSWTRLVMSNSGGDLYQATIPSQTTGSNVHYYLWARDRWISPNSGCDPVGAPADGYYSFHIGPVGIHEYRLAAIQFMPLTPNPTSRDVQIRFMIHDTRYPINNFSLKIYDAAGRMVRDLSRNLESCIMNHESVLSWNRTDDTGRQVSNGIYFVKFNSAEQKMIEKVVLVK